MAAGNRGAHEKLLRYCARPGVAVELSPGFARDARCGIGVCCTVCDAGNGHRCAVRRLERPRIPAQQHRSRCRDNRDCMDVRFLFAVLAITSFYSCTSSATSDAGGGDADPSDVRSDVVLGVRDPTFWRDVAPILRAQCTACHRLGGVAPFPLLEYDDASARADLIAHQASTRRMPPWPPAGGNCRPLRFDRTLTNGDIETLANWALRGTPEGARADFAPRPEGPVDPVPATPPDISLDIGTDYLPQNLISDDLHCFVLDAGLARSQDVIAFRVVPGAPRIVHHVVVYEVRTSAFGELDRLDSADPGPGYGCYGGSGLRGDPRLPDPGATQLAVIHQQLIGVWGFGQGTIVLPEGTGIRLAMGSRLVVQIHYHVPSHERSTTDRSRVELYLAPTPVARPGYWVPLSNSDFRIPAGAGPADPRATIGASLRAQTSFPVYGVFPHMHRRGSSLRAWSQTQDGATQCFVDIPRWDFHWQYAYWLTQPLLVNGTAASGDRLELRCVFDNSVSGQPVVDGGRLPLGDVVWGENTDNEMCSVLLYAVF